MTKHHENHPEYAELGIFAGYGEEEECMHTLQVSISETECQCTGCLRIWKKPEGFVSDIPWQDRG